MLCFPEFLEALEKYPLPPVAIIADAVITFNDGPMTSHGLQIQPTEIGIPVGVVWMLKTTYTGIHKVTVTIETPDGTINHMYDIPEEATKLFDKFAVQVIPWNLNR
jgi:hypothetical protein